MAGVSPPKRSNQLSGTRRWKNEQSSVEKLTGTEQFPDEQWGPRFVNNLYDSINDGRCVH